jgi:hypothetical protein
MHRASLALCLLLCPAVARAHGIEAGRAEGQLRGATLFLVVAAEASQFMEFDASGDGVLDRDEVQRARDGLRARFEASLCVRDAEGRAPTLGFFDVGVPTRLVSGAKPHVRFTVDLSWPSPPASMTVTHSFADPQLWLEVVRVAPAGPGQWSALGPAETVRFASGTRSPPLLASSAPAEIARRTAPTRTAAPAPSASPRAGSAYTWVSPVGASALAAAALSLFAWAFARRRSPRGVSR